jgi:uncharacterized protein (DUF1501 family)
MFHDFSRRDLLRMSMASAFGVSFSGWLPRLAHAAESQGAAGRKACILLWMPGGPSQTDTFDLKPGHANGGPFKEITTAAPDIRFSEHLPLLAKQAKDMAIIRSMTSKEGDHGLATQLMTTGYRRMAGAIDYPSIGSIVAKELGREDDMLPGYVSVSPFRFGDAGGAGFLGPNYSPLTVTGSSDNPEARANLSIENLSPPANATADSMKKRFEILGFLQDDFRKKAGGASTTAHRANAEKAKRMIESQAKNAFKLEEEPAALRDAYGRNRFGQGCLLARRLIERGVSFVEVGLTGAGANTIGWDTHTDNFASVKTLSETLDPAWATLMTDLRDRGMLENTLIVWMGEFGRTPKINPNQGRDHWPDAWSTVLCGAGIQGGRVIGKSGKGGEGVDDRPVTPPEFLATVCQAIGIDHTKENISTIGRPISIVETGTQPVKELLRGEIAKTA